MSDIHVTLSGNVTDDPRQYQFRDGSRVTSLRMAVNRRVLDPKTNTWQTRDTTYYTVRCYRGLADNVHQSVRKGHPVVVYGKLRIKQFERDGEQRFWAEVEASSVGHDLKWGITSFEKPVRVYSGAAPSDDDQRRMEDATREWELAADTGANGVVPEGAGSRARRSVAVGRQIDGENAEVWQADESDRPERPNQPDRPDQSGESGESGESEEPDEAVGADEVGDGGVSWLPDALAA
ncbi:single-stranded DNA-binding protein [Microbispora sp. RL4-1S]|uniref:Single-stranded DNA-binding protein n=1 Tax=Microbispora oryzae TaxID=2806554 RepID=A0A941AGD3_9ACTN|nr:single-stranded DNA-binding protein [Microbispora oryzae]MBP2702881.1 single-stranded DNA-binding protein [Microbispora oryzae]